MRVFNLVVTAFLVMLSSGCSGSSGGSAGQSSGESTVLSSKMQVVDVFEKASTTLAMAVQESAFPLDTIDLIAYTYDAENELPVSGGTIEFSAQLQIDNNTSVEIPIGTAPLINGRADMEWKTTDEHSGDFLVQARYAGDASIAPSRWQFQQHIAQPDDKGAVLYSMARMNHLVNLMFHDTASGQMKVNSVFEDGEVKLLSEVLMEEFGLELLESFYRIKNGPEDVLIHNDTETFFKSVGTIRTKKVELTVKTSFFMAANDDVLVLIIKGTDGQENADLNDEGSPSNLLGGAGAFHPGWSWMTQKLTFGWNGFIGFNGLVDAHRQNPNGVERALYIGGHSLGGALARMSMLVMADRGRARPGDQVFSFGAPWQGAYNKLFKLAPFEKNAQIVFSTNNIGYTAMEGSLDQVPFIPEVTVIQEWNEGVNGVYGLSGVYMRALLFEVGGISTTEVICGVVGVINTVSRFFGGGRVADNCKNHDVELSDLRPIGFAPPPRWQTIVFNSKNHYRRFLSGEIAARKCSRFGVCNVIADPDDCTGFILCHRLYHTTDVGGIDDFNAKNAHWVGDYEFGSKRRLHGNLEKPNFYFPASRGGDIRKPIDIVALP